MKYIKRNAGKKIAISLVLNWDTTAFQHLQLLVYCLRNNNNCKINFNCRMFFLLIFGFKKRQKNMFIIINQGIGLQLYFCSFNPKKKRVQPSSFSVLGIQK